MSFWSQLFCCSEEKPRTSTFTLPKKMSEETNDTIPKETSFRILKGDLFHCHHNYKSIAKLGRGAFGEVFLMAEYDQNPEDINKKVAIKVVRSSKYSSDEKFEECAFWQKNVSLALKDEKFIIKFISSFSNAKNGDKYLVFEYASGGNMYSLLKKKERSEMFKQNHYQNARFVAACVVEGVKVLHKNKYVYRDLKLQNLLIMGNDEDCKQNEKGYIKIADFGIVGKLVEEKDYFRKGKAGTTDYMAPEMLGNRKYNRSVDFWALGILIYELFAGTIPFTQVELESKQFDKVVRLAHQNKRFNLLHAPQAAKNLITSLLQLDPQQRIGFNSIQDIRNHQFFNGFDWASLQSMSMKSPILDIVIQHPQNKISQFNYNFDEDTGFEHRYYQNFTTHSVDRQSPKRAKNIEFPHEPTTE